MRTITINDIEFTPDPALKYRSNYVEIHDRIRAKSIGEINVFRQLVWHDLFFIVYFIFGIKEANHPFVVQACRDVEEGQKSMTLDMWGREHYKSVIITRAESLQRILFNPEERIGIFSHTRPAAKSFLRSIKHVLESSRFLKTVFPDILYKKPSTEAPKWSEDDGLTVKRKGFYSESSIEAWGLSEGMPTGKHFTHRVYDDITTKDLVRNPEMIEKVKEAFDMSDNLGTADGTHRVVGTPYHYEDTLAYVAAKKFPDGSPVYRIRKKPTLEGGDWNGKPVLLPEERIERLKTMPEMFKTQHLLDPAPSGTEVLNPDYLKSIEHRLIPGNIQRFMTVDPAGSSAGKDGDAWAIMLFGVEPNRDDIGASNVYVLDALISPLNHSEAIESIVRMYCGGGVIQRLGIEKVGQSTTEIHVTNALQAKGRYLSENNKSLYILRPAGRNKVDRIEGALSWALNNGKLFISTNVPACYEERLRLEMRKFPYWHDDGIDAFSYLYDMIKDCTFMSSWEKRRRKEAFERMRMVG